MADSDYQSRLDELERDNLQSAVSSAERVIEAAGKDVPLPLKAFVENARGRIGVLDKKIKESQTERESHAREQVTLVANMAQKETALTASEKQTYSGFLEKSFFTKNDFSSLEKFYDGAWERLSQGGKDEMSHRIWEGIRKDEYSFGDLPKTVREKEAKQAYDLLRHPSTGVDAVLRIPAQDREDFIRAYESGKRDEAGKMLERDSFKKGMFLEHESAVRQHSGVDLGRSTSKADVAKGAIESATAKDAPRVPKAAKSSDSELEALNFEGIKTADVSSSRSPTEIPNTKHANATQQGSARSC